MKLSKNTIIVSGLILSTLHLYSCVRQADAFFFNTSPCPGPAIASMDAEFGAGTSEDTSCIQNRTAILEVVSWNSAALNRRTGAGQQPHTTNNIVKNYKQMYGMVAGKDFQTVAVGFSGGARWMLNDEAYNRSYNVTTGNPSRLVLEALLNEGVTVLLCQNTMRSNGWVKADLAAGVKMVPSGAVTVIDLQESGYSYISP